MFPLCISAKIQVRFPSPGVIEVRWNSTFGYNSSMEFRIILNDILDPLCKEPLSKTNCSCTISGNIPNSAYDIQLVACELDETNPSKCTQQSLKRRIFLPPEAPTSYTAVAHDNQSIEFAWKTPVQNIEGLTINLWVRANEHAFRSKVDASEGLQKCIVAGLNPLTEYNTSLSFENLENNLIENCNQTIKVLTLPNAPTINISNVESNRISVTFYPMEGAESFNLVFAAMAADKSGNKRNCSVGAGSQNIGCKIEGLQFETQYKITAQACVGLQCSVESPPITVETQRGDSRRLDDGAIAGIVLGIIIAILLIILIVFICTSKPKGILLRYPTPKDSTP
uniref:Fibronectin type-III domain-containing protein n=1 Tax=Schistocephalus solidus TaxID=70667 RepID=A0A0V0J8I5_SCHSO